MPRAVRGRWAPTNALPVVLCLVLTSAAFASALAGLSGLAIAADPASTGSSGGAETVSDLFIARPSDDDDDPLDSDDFEDELDDIDHDVALDGDGASAASPAEPSSVLGQSWLTSLGASAKSTCDPQADGMCSAADALLSQCLSLATDVIVAASGGDRAPLASLPGNINQAAAMDALRGDCSRVIDARHLVLVAHALGILGDARGGVALLEARLAVLGDSPDCSDLYDGAALLLAHSTVTSDLQKVIHYLERSIAAKLGLEWRDVNAADVRRLGADRLKHHELRFLEWLHVLFLRVSRKRDAQDAATLLKLVDPDMEPFEPDAQDSTAHGADGAKQLLRWYWRLLRDRAQRRRRSSWRRSGHGWKKRRRSSYQGRRYRGHRGGRRGRRKK